MKLKKEHWWRPDLEFTIAEAVDADCTMAHADGTVERLGEARDATAALVGRLVQELRKAGVLDDLAIIRILDGGWRKVDS